MYIDAMDGSLAFGEPVSIHSIVPVDAEMVESNSDINVRRLSSLGSQNHAPLLHKMPF